MNFLKTLLAVILGFFISMGIFFLMTIIMISALAFAISDEKEETTVKDNSVLVMDFSEKVSDYDNATVFSDFNFSQKNYNAMNQLLRALKEAQEDDRIKGITLKTSPYLSGFAQIKELRDALKEFKSSGKFIYAYNDFIDQRNYYLQSVADSVFVSPVGTFEFHGLTTELLYFKDFEDKSGIKYEVIRHGKYKSAVEPFLSSTMSQENREQITSFLSSFWNSVVEEISESRGIAVEKLNEIARHLQAENPKKALANRLVDRLLYQDEFDKTLLSAMQLDDIKDVNFITIDKYAETLPEQPTANKDKSKIAVIYAEGTIVYGVEGIVTSRGSFSHKTINEALREIREDKNVKAIVLRINSPGGSALASELIHREIEITKEQIPVYVSMGNYAASGGYYIASNANRIFADNTTLTGSIGVFATILNVEGLAQKLGINAEQVSTHDNTKLQYSLFEKTSPDFISLMQTEIEDTYQLFIQRVAQGRSMTMEQVDEIAQGRVWSGEQAKEIGLVDEIASLEEVLAYVAQKHQLEDYVIEEFPVRKSNLRDFFSQLEYSLQQRIAEKLLGKSAYRVAEKVIEAPTEKGIQAKIPFLMDIR